MPIFKNPMWKYLNESVAGTSHLETGKPCQDFSVVVPYSCGNEEILIVACSDGAGSAREAQAASESACKTVVSQIVGFFGSGRKISDITDDVVRDWFGGVHLELKSQSERREIGLREFSCTLLVGVIGDKRAVFAQVGDGAIVIWDGSRYRPVFWPDTGEYHNTTYFVADPKFAEHLHVAHLESVVNEAAFLSDGLQMLALTYATKEAHGPFFAPMFKQLREHAREDLVIPMRQFLDSSPVNDLTDDDKTLVLAMRTTGSR